MSRIAFVGGAYQSQAFSADAQVCVNLMPEKVESGAGKSEVILVNTPGLATAYQLPDQPVRGEWTVSTPGVIPRGFVIAGSTLFELLQTDAGTTPGTTVNGKVINLGTVANDGKPVSFASSNIQLMIASGGQGYCLTLATNTLTAAIPTIAGVTQVMYIRGFFTATIGGTAQWFLSNALDGTTWNAGTTTIISDFSDNIVSTATYNLYVCFFGKKKSECYYVSGAANFPLEPAPGGFTGQGSAATFGIVNADNTLFGIWAEENGGGVAFRLNGNVFQRISTHAIENTWQGYSTISDAVGYSIQIGGHTLVIWYFPSAANGSGRTWAYDVASGLWFEMAYFQNGVQKAHRSCCHMVFGGKHLVGDPLSGNIYQMSFPAPDGLGGWNFVTDFGNPIIRDRIAPYVGTAGVFNFFTSLEILGDTGLGPNIPLKDGSGNSRGPQLMITWSDTLGKVWSNERILDMGQIGKFGTRMITRRLGKVWGSTARLFRLRFSDAAPIRIVDADLIADPDMPAQKRIAQQLRERA